MLNYTHKIVKQFGLCSMATIAMMATDSVDTYFTDAKMLRMDRVGPKVSKQ